MSVLEKSTVKQIDLVKDEEISQKSETFEKSAWKESLIFAAKTGYHLLRIIFIVLLVIFVFSNSYWVPEGYVAVQTRFGSFVNNKNGIIKVPGGPYLAWPYPINNVIKIPTTIQHVSVNDAFIIDKNRKTVITSVLQKPDVPDVPGALITGDKNLVQGTWEINYRIEYSSTFHKSLNNIELFVNNTGTIKNCNRIIKMLSEQAIISVIAGTTVSNFVAGRISHDIIREKIQKMADSLYTGITVINVSTSHYGPHHVLESDFQAANQAESEKALQIENAIRYRMTNLSETAGENWEELLNTIDCYESDLSSSNIKNETMYFNKVKEILLSDRIGGKVAIQIDNARIDKTRTIEKSRSAESQYNKLLAAYNSDPHVLKNQLFQDVLLDVLNGPLVKVRWFPSGTRLYLSDLGNED